MTKKIKIKDLEDDPNLPQPKEEQSSQVIDWEALDKLSEEKTPEVPHNSINPSKKNVEVKEKPKQIIEKLVYFKRNIYISYLSKCFSIFLIFASLDLISHIMKFFEGINVTDFSNFQSIFLVGGINWIICKVIGFLIIVYFFANKDEIIVNTKGLYCSNPEISDSIFLNTKSVFIPWEKMNKVKLKFRLFEPYLFFYDINGNKLGHLEFSVDSKVDFFKYIESKAGTTHPLALISSENFLI